MDRSTKMEIKKRALRLLGPKIKRFANRAFWTIREYNRFGHEYHGYKDVAEVEETIRMLIKHVLESNDVFDTYCTTGGLKVSYTLKDGCGEAEMEISLTEDVFFDGAKIKPLPRKRMSNTLLEVSK